MMASLRSRALMGKSRFRRGDLGGCGCGCSRRRRGAEDETYTKKISCMLELAQKRTN